MSGAPPGGMVTSIRMGRVGYGACACAAVHMSASSATVTRRAFGFMIDSDADGSMTRIGSSALESQMRL